MLGSGLLRSALLFCSIFLILFWGIRMLNLTIIPFRFVEQFFKTRAALHAENLALRHQLCVLQRSVKKPGGDLHPGTPTVFLGNRHRR